MNPGDHIVLSLDVPAHAVARTGGDIPKATTAFVTLFQSHPHTKAGLGIFGLKVDSVIGVKDAPEVTIIFKACKETEHKSSDAIGFLTGVWKDLSSTMSSAPKKPWWKLW